MAQWTHYTHSLFRVTPMSVFSQTCQCGECYWEVVDATPGTLVCCYCRSCQGAMKHLGLAETRLNPEGGTLIFQTLPDNFRMIRGTRRLKSFRMTPKGVVRWYVDCCNTPVANTIATAALPFVGVILPPDTEVFGPSRNHAFTETALSPVKQRGMARVGWGVIGRGLLGKLTGRTASPFFEAGHLRVAPELLSREDREAVI
ncbi:hypothetical protein SAMN05421759_10657 [Roseivivax lentus]|uniref:CENP-V/GFA domain-containing protein n=1 Tax=Roseivivax lentus TaxID=633194 RepID=A0A1N7MYV1_9RHOB|nr:DUF6151 family protein [Roseivivax lentus]SIS91198.1 hypothetical protein SAMN05421759_10657 [Roseivivax lentus]